MTYCRSLQTLANPGTQAFKNSRLIAIAVLAVFALIAMRPAQAQSTDTWKSVAIIGGSTAAGAYVGHKIGGSTGALVGAGVGASAGYAIDRRRRANEYNQNAYYNDNGNGYYGNGAYNGPYDGSAYPYAAGYRSENYRSQDYR